MKQMMLMVLAALAVGVVAVAFFVRQGGDERSVRGEGLRTNVPMSSDAVAVTAAAPAPRQTPTVRNTYPFEVALAEGVRPCELNGLVARSGARIVSYLPRGGAIVEATDEVAAKLRAMSEIAAVSECVPSTKFAPGFRERLAQAGADESVRIALSLVNAEDAQALAQRIVVDGGTVHGVTDSKSAFQWISAELPAARIAAFADRAEVKWLEPVSRIRFSNATAVKADHIDVERAWDKGDGLGLSGAGQVIGHMDTAVDFGTADNPTPEFLGRIKAYFDLTRGTAPSDTSGHGTHTAGSIVGQGVAALGGKFRGVAYGAQLVHQACGELFYVSFDNLNAAFSQAYGCGARIHSDSWGEEKVYHYDALAQSVDQFVWEHPNFLPVMAAGNDGPKEGSVGSPSLAKNALVVGSSENFAGYELNEGYEFPKLVHSNAVQRGLANTSSRGACTGVLKPDVVAPGECIVSVRSLALAKNPDCPVYTNDTECGTRYGWMSGTSMATPQVAGAMALMREWYQKREGKEPSAAMLAAMAVGGAHSLYPGRYAYPTNTQMTAHGPNPDEGWGEIGVAATLAPTNGIGIALYDTQMIPREVDVKEEIALFVTNSSQTLTVALSWVDYPGDPRKPGLINDYDLELFAPDGTLYYPNGLAAADSNNVHEVTVVTNAMAGRWTAAIRKTKVPKTRGGALALYARGALGSAADLPRPPRTFEVGSDADLAEALHEARSGDTLKLAAGTFAPLSIDGKGLTVFGAGADETIIDGDRTGRCVNVVSPGGAGQVVIEGVTLQNGRADVGAGIRGGTLRHSVVRNCRATISGGGAGDAVLDHCVISNCWVEVEEAIDPDVDKTTGFEGGGAFQSSLYNCLVAHCGVSNVVCSGNFIRKTRGGGVSRCNICNVSVVDSQLFWTHGGNPVDAEYCRTNQFGIAIATEGEDGKFGFQNSLFSRTRLNADETVENLNGIFSGLWQCSHVAALSTNDFINFAADDFRLAEHAVLAVDRGVTSYLDDCPESSLSRFDLAGTNRLQGLSVDLGCYESPFTNTAPGAVSGTISWPSNVYMLAIGVGNPSVILQDVSMVNDAVQMSQHAATYLEIPAPDTLLVTGTNATPAAVSNAFDTLVARARTNDLVFLSVSTHGGWSLDETGVPICGTNNCFVLWGDGETLCPPQLKDFETRLTNRGARLVCVYDFCFSGGFASAADVPALAASTEQEMSDDTNPEGIFTETFLSLWRRPPAEADLDGDGILSFHEMGCLLAERYKGTFIPGRTRAEVTEWHSDVLATIPLRRMPTLSDPLEVLTTGLSRMYSGMTYSYQLQATGGDGTNGWTALSPLPGGLTLEAGGLLHGIPQSVKMPTNLVVRVTDASGASATANLPVEDVLFCTNSAPRVVSLSVAPGPVVRKPGSGDWTVSVRAEQPVTTNEIVYVFEYGTNENQTVSVTNTTGRLTVPAAILETGAVSVNCHALQGESHMPCCYAWKVMTESSESPNLLVNGSFENPPNATSFYEFHASGEEGLGWQALSLDGQVEIGSVRGAFGSLSRSAYGATRAGECYQFAELSANAVGALFQKVKTVPGRTYRWGWSRKARFATEATAFWTLSPEKFEEAKELYLQYLRGEQPLSVIRPAVQALTNEHFVCTHADVEVSGDTMTWKRYEGEYTVPAGQMETYVVLVEWNENPRDSQGCLVDGVVFFDSDEVLLRRGIVEVSNVKGGTATVTIDGKTVTLGEGTSAYDFYETNKTLAVSVETSAGYTFLGAFVSGYVNETAVYQNGVAFLPADRLAACPVRGGSQHFALAYGKDCTISFLPNGGAYERAEKTLAKTAGSSFVPGVPTRAGFVFTGWRERTTLKMLKKDVAIIWKDDCLVATAADGSLIIVPAADGLQLLACWTRDNDLIPVGHVEFTDGFGESRLFELNRNDSMPAAANPKFQHREDFVEYELVGWRLPSFDKELSTNVTAVYVGVPNAAKGGATDGVMKFMDVQGHALAITNCPGVMLEAIWQVKRTNEWAVFNASVEDGATSYFDTLSAALAALKKGDTLLARPPAEGFGFGEGLKPDTNDVITVNCPFSIATDDVTVDLNGRVLNRTVEGKADDYLVSVVGAKGVTIRNGYLFSVGDSYDRTQRLGPQACRAVKIDNLAEALVEDVALYFEPLVGAVLVDRSSTARFLGCYLDGEGDGAEGVICARNGSALSFKDCKGQWNVDNFWNNPILRGSLDNITGEQFLIDGSGLTLDNTVISNSYDYAQMGALPYIVTVRGESTITLENGAGIREGERGSTQGAIRVEGGSCTVGNGREDGLRIADGFVIGRMVVEDGATFVAGAAAYSDDPTAYLPEGGTVIVGDRGYSVVVSSGSKPRDMAEYAVAASGIENIHVNKYVPYTESYPGHAVGNASLWLKMAEDGLAKKLYLEQHYRGVDVITNGVPDAFFPTNTVVAHVWRGQGAALTNAYNLLTTDVAKTIFDPEVVGLLTNFSPFVKSVTRGVGSATIPYVDADGTDQLGKAVVLGCEPGDWTAYEILVNELTRIGDGYEDSPSAGVRRFVLTNSTVKILGSRTPSVTCGPSGYVYICSSPGVENAIILTGREYVKTGRKPFYDACRSRAVAGDAELRRIDPTYVRDCKTEGFERFAYAYLSDRCQLAVAKMLEDLGISPTIAGTNRAFRYFATLCSEKCTDENDRMRIDLQGSEAAIRAIGFSIRFTNLLLVNAGIVGKDFMTFDDEWKFDPEALAKISAWAKSAREELGLNGVDYWFKETNDWATAFADIGCVPGKGFEQLFCAGRAGGPEENPCEACLPTNTVAGFVFQPSAAAWTELNERLFTLLGKKSEALDRIFAAFKSHPNSFGKSASIGVVLGSEAKTYGTTGGISGALGAVSSVKIEDENLWYSIRILLEQFGCTTRVSEKYPSITVCELPDSAFHVSYDREYRIVKLSTGNEYGQSAAAALRDPAARLISPYNDVFNDRMGIDVEAGETLSDHNTLFYFAPQCDTVLYETLKDYLDTIGLGALRVLIKAQDRSDLWLCGYGVKDGNGLFSAKSNLSKSIWDKYHLLFEASCKTFGQIAAAAFPYDASKARVFATGGTTLHVSRADNWDDVNHCLYPYDGDNIRLRVQLLDFDGQPYDRTVSARLDADGHFAFEKDKFYFRGYLTSEGFFGEFDVLSTGYFIGRQAPEIEPELSILPSAEEIAAQVKQVVEAIGISNITVGAAKSDDRTGPFGEDTVVRETTIVPTPGGGLDRLIAKEPYAGKTTPACYMPSNTLFGTTFGFADGALTNAIAAIRYVQPELMEYFEKLFGGLGFDQEILASVMDGLALGISKEENGLEPYFVVRLNRGQKHHWVDLTNRLYTATGVTVTDFQTSHSPDTWEAIAFTVEDPLTGRTIERAYTRVFESEDRDPFFIVTRSTELMSGIMARVRRAGVFGAGRLLDDATFWACEIPRESETRGFAYLAPIEDRYWSFDLISVTEDGELAVRRRTSAAVAPIEATVARFAVNFFEALRGETSKISFENDPEADKVAEAVTSNVVAQLRHMRTRLGVTGLDFYDDDPDEDGRYGNSELAIGTKGDGCEFLRRFAANAPSESALVEEYVPVTACALATVNGEPGLLVDDVDNSLKVLADLIGEKCPVTATITNFLASDEWRIAAESFRLTGTHRAVAVLQDLDNPFVKDIGGGNYASISAGYSVLTVFGPMDSSLPFLLIKQAFGERAHWKAFTTNGIEYLVHDGQFEDRDLSQFIRPTFAFNAADNVMVFATSLKAARLAVLAGRDGENRLIDSETFADVTGFKPDEPMPEHNTLYYFALQNDDILGCTLRRVLSPYLPESYAMLLDRPSLKGYWGAAHGVRDGDVFRLYTHAGAKVHTAFLAAGQALLKTIAEGIRISQPYDWTEPKVFRSADTVRLVEPTAEKGVYIISAYSVSGDFLKSFIDRADSDNNDRFCDYEYAVFMSRRGIFLSTNNGGISSYRAEYDSFHLMILDEETDPVDFTGGVAMDFDAREQTFPAGEKVDQRLRIYPADAKVTKVTGLPRGLSLKKAKDGYFLSGTPTKVGEDCYVMLTAACAGRQTTSHNFHFMVSNYASDYATLEAGYGLTAGVDDTLMLTNVIGWTASGVPSGMKFDKTTGALSGTPAKPGEYLVTFTTKIDGKTEKVSTVITVDQGDGIQIDVGFSDKTSEIAADGETREIYAGVKIDWPVEVKGLEDVETTLTAKGLPNGLKLVKTTDKVTKEVSYSIQGIATKASAVDKKTGEVKPSAVVLSGTNKYKWTGEESFDLVVKALPDWAIGTFNGYHGTVLGEVRASVKVTVSKVGKLSISMSGVSPTIGRVQTDSFACTGFDSYDPQNKCFAFAIGNVKWKGTTDGTFHLSGAIGLDKDLAGVGLEVGRYIAHADMGEDLLIQAASNYDWGKWTFPTGRNQLTLELSDSINPGLEGLTLKFAKGGKVTVAGKVTDPETGRKVSVSASSVLVSESDGVFGDGILCASVGFVVKTATPFYAYVPLWLAVGEGGTIVEVYESDPTKDGVCSWSWGADMEGVLEQMAEHKVNRMQLSTVPWLIECATEIGDRVSNIDAALKALR